MPLNIPIPKTMMQSFLDTQHGLQQNRLMQAQGQQAQGSAAKNNMLANLMNIAFGPEESGGQNISGTTTGQQSSGSGISGQNTASTRNPSDRRAQAKEILYGLGYLKETPQAQEARENREADLKAGRDVDVASKKAKNETDLKRAQDLVETGKMINKYSQYSTSLSDLLNKKDITGNWAAFKNWANLSGEDVGTFTENATPLIGQLAKDLSAKGGAVVANMASAAKPQLKKSRDYNIGVLNELHKQTYRSYQEAKKEYESLTGKPYPVKLSKFYDKVRIGSPNGHKAVKSPEEAKKLIEKYPGSKILGNAYESE